MQRTLFTIIYLGLLLSVCNLPVHATENISGLKFISHEAVKENRTSLILTPKRDIHINGNFSINFDISFGKAMYTFGYIFRIIIDDETNLDMVSEVSSDNPKINVIYNQRSLLEYNGKGELPTFNYNKWMHISLLADKTNDSIIVSIDGMKKSFAQPLERSSNLKIYFGQNTHNHFYASDVPKMDIRDIKISGDKDKLLYHWILGKHNGNTVYDEVARKPAEVINPVWLIDRHAYWEEKLSVTVPHSYLHVATDPGNGRVYFADSNYLACFDNSDSATPFTQLPVKYGNPFQSKPNQMIFDPVENRLISYDTELQRLSVYNYNTESWSLNDTASTITRFWHHNAMFVPEEKKMVLFGGYGMHHYSAQLTVVDFSTPEPQWRIFDLSKEISPRYLSGMTYEGDSKILISGGYGSYSGAQSESPHNLYDLYRVDISNGNVELLSNNDKSKDTEPFVFGNSTVLSEDKQTIYALVFNDKRYATEIQLTGTDINSGETYSYANPIPYEFMDIESYCTLMRDEKSNELLIVETKLMEDMQTRIKIYALKYPPLNIVDTIQEEGNTNLLLYLLIAGLIVILIIVLYIIYNRKKKTISATTEVNKGIEASQSPAMQLRNHYNLYQVEKQPSSISLLGGFHVTDKNGKDITGNFTQTVRQLFLLILLETYKNGHGISSQKLTDFFWFDKDPENARNNRNVNMYKLRSLLQEIGEIDITKNNSYWQLSIKESVFCDYSMILQIMKEIEESSSPDTQTINALVKLASFGKLLCNTQTEWIDAYKSEFTIRLIELLERISEMDKIKKDYPMLLRIAEAILAHDSLDEDAIRIKCTALYSMGKKNQAKISYDAFVTEYEKILNTKPEFKFSDVVGK